MRLIRIRRAWAAALTMIPTTTGTAKSIAKVIPEMSGRMDNSAVHVSVPNVSAIDLTVLTEKPATVTDVKDRFSKASASGYNGVLGFVNEKLVSTDINHDPHSSSFVVDQTYVNDNHRVRLIAWFDNDWGFSNRMLDCYSDGKLFES